MANYIVLVNNVVKNFVVAETKEDAELATKGVCIEMPEGVKIDYDDICDPETKTFSKSVEETPAE